jgi:hypothetical protein
VVKASAAASNIGRIISTILLKAGAWRNALKVPSLPWGRVPVQRLFAIGRVILTGWF